MSFILLSYVLVFATFHIIVAIQLKRQLAVRYDKKTLISTLMLVITAIVMYFGGYPKIEFHNTITLEDKVHWLILVVLVSNAVIQFLFWLIYSLLRAKELTRLPRFTFNIFSWLLIITASITFAKYFFDLNLVGILVTSTVLSAIIGLSVQDTLTNLFAGISLQTEAPFNIGEWVSLGDQEGKVVNQNWRSLTLLTRDNHVVTLPNKFVAQEKIVNYSRPTRRQTHKFDVMIDYEHPPNQIIELLSELLNSISGVEIDNKVRPFVKEFADSGIIYTLRFWVEDYVLWPYVQGSVLARLWYKLKRKNIKIPYPISELHMEVIDREKKNKENDYNKTEVFKHINRLSWMTNLSKEQKELLSDKAWMESYAKGENLIKQGDHGDSMFIVIQGTADVILKSSKEQEAIVTNKLPGDFFGEMSLLTGGPRSATIRALTDMLVIIIDKEAFTEILSKDMNILDLFLTSLESNQSVLSDIIEKFKKESETNESPKKLLLKKIKSYLNI